MDKRISDYINNNFEELQQITKRVTQNHQLSDDLLQEVILQMYEKGNIQLREYTDDDIKYYIISWLKLNWNSKTSPFYYKIRKESRNYTEIHPSFINYRTTEQEDEILSYEEMVTLVEEEFTELNWFSKRLMELYLTLGSLKKVSVQTTIPIASVGRYIREIKTEIRINVEKRIKDE
jgi:hydroxymethylpyrimidine pyrophosphatase-like HAD family hydrolase